MKIGSQSANLGSFSSEPESHQQILERIAHAISGLRFGSVEVVIQDSRVVQIERKEKFRFDKDGRR